MNELQERLLSMVKEIDGICQRNSIPYYLSGGSVIGALRHRGFIPWDDDIDILIDSKYWKQMHEALMRELPENRALACFENDEHDLHNTVYRYCDTTTTNIHKNELLGVSIAGVVVDILLLDPVPSNPEAVQEHLVDLCLYSDIVNPYYAYSHRFAFPIPFKEYKARAELEGKRPVLAELDERLRKYEGQDVDAYMVRWAAGPNVFPRECFGKPTYVPFEDTMLPIPERASDFLREVYGDEWYEVPEPDDQSTHETVFDMKHGFMEYYNEYLPRVDVERLDKRYQRSKMSQIETAPLQREDQKNLAKIQLLKEKTIAEKAIARSGIDIMTLFERKDREALWGLLGDYMAYQGSVDCLGSEYWNGLQRKYDPVYLDCGDDVLSVMLWLWMSSGRIAKANKVLAARKMVLDRELAGLILEAAEFITDYRKVNSLYYIGENAQALSLVESLMKRSKLPILPLWKLKIRLKRELGQQSQDEEEQLIREALEINPGDGELLKYRIDNLAAQTGVAKQFEAYIEALANTRNGLVWLEIADVLEKNADECIDYIESLRKKGDYVRATELSRIWINCIGCKRSELERVYHKSIVDFANDYHDEKNPNSWREMLGHVSLKYKLEDYTERVLRRAIRTLDDDEYYISLLAEYRENRGIPTDMIREELRFDFTSEIPQFKVLLDELRSTTNHDGSPSKAKLIIRCLLRLGRLREAFAFCREQVAKGDTGYPFMYLRRDLRKMIRAVERAHTNDYRQALLRECSMKYESIDQVVDYCVLFELIEETQRDEIRAYFKGLADGSIGCVRNSPILDAEDETDEEIRIDDVTNDVSDANEASSSDDEETKEDDSGDEGSREEDASGDDEGEASGRVIDDTAESESDDTAVAQLENDVEVGE